MLARLFRDLAPFQPTLIGTYPLGLAVDGSDLDIACTCDDLHRFERALHAALSGLGIAPRVERSETGGGDPDGLAGGAGGKAPRGIERSDAAGGPAVVAAFDLGDVAVEIFGQAVPVTAQRGFRHMVIEGQLLAIGGAALAGRVRDLKRAGTRTEPAFAQVLGLD